MKLALFLITTIFSGLLAVSCSDNSSVPCLTKIIDMSTEETMDIELTYDSRGQMITFGPTSISYKRNKIIAKNSKEMLGYGRFYTIEFTLDGGKVVSSESHCNENIHGQFVEVNKINNYSYSNNKITVESKSYDFKSKKLLKSSHEVREIGEDGKMIKVIQADSYHGDGVILYKYDANLACKANVNLQAFTYSATGLDELLVYLLNLTKIPRVNVLPEEVHYTYANEPTHLYNENCSMDGDRLTKLEIMLNYKTLITRMNFEYMKEED